MMQAILLKATEVGTVIAWVYNILAVMVLVMCGTLWLWPPIDDDSKKGPK